MRRITPRQLKAIHNMINTIDSADYRGRTDAKEYQDIKKLIKSNKIINLYSTDRDTEKIFNYLLNLIKLEKQDKEVLNEFMDLTASDGVFY